MDCHRHDHGFAGAELPLQRPRYDRKFELDSADAKERRTTSIEPKGTTANAIDSRFARRKRQNLATDQHGFSRMRELDLENPCFIRVHLWLIES